MKLVVQYVGAQLGVRDVLFGWWSVRVYIHSVLHSFLLTFSQFFDRLIGHVVFFFRHMPVLYICIPALLGAYICSALHKPLC